MKRETKQNIRTPVEINLGRYEFSLFTYMVYVHILYMLL